MRKLFFLIGIAISLCILLAACSERPMDNDTYVVFNGQAVEGKDGWLFYNGDRSVDVYKGLEIYSTATMNKLISAMERLDRACRDRNKKVVFMIQPNKEIVYGEHMPDLTIYSQKRRGEKLLDYVKSKSNVSFVYPLADILGIKDTYQAYYAHDTHWNSMGGFIGVQNLYRALGLPETDPADLNPVETIVSGGDLVVLGNLDPADYPTDIEYSFSYKSEVPYVRYESKYPSSVGNVLFTEIDDAVFDCSIAYIGDSFRQAMVQFLTKDFSKTMILHHAQLEIPEVLQTVKDSDIIVLAFVERYATSLANDADRLFSLLTE